MNEMNDKRYIPAQIDEKTLEKAERVLMASGISLSDAVNSFLEEIALSEDKNNSFSLEKSVAVDIGYEDLEKSMTHNVLNSSPMFIIRLKGNNNNYRVVYANEKLISLTPNKSLADIQAHYDRFGLGVHLMDRDQEEVQNIIKTLKRVGETNIAEGRVMGENGEIRWMRCMCTLVAIEDGENVIQQIITDITKEKEAQFAIERMREENYLRQIFSIISENTKDAYLLFSLDDFAAEYVTPNLERLIGIPQALVYEQGMDAVRPEGWDPKDSRGSILRIEPGKSVVYDRVRTHKITKEILQFTDRFYITNLNGKPKGLLIISDVTEEVKAKDALNLALQNANNASRAKSEFLSNMSHDIRTPMNSIMGMLTLLKKETRLTAKGRELFGKLEISASNMLEILNNVLDMSGIESGKIVLRESVLNTEDVKKEISAIFATIAGAKGVNMKAEVSLKYDKYQADPVAVKKVLSNVLSNAVKFTSPGGHVHVKIVSKGMNAYGYDKVEFLCLDTGVGMDEDFIEKLYNPFEREMDTKINYVSGTGLGMAIAKNLVDMMNGTIAVESKKGEGTQVLVSVPLKPIHEESIPEIKEEKLPDTDIKGARILLVEDNELNAEIFTELLQDEGAQVRYAENGKIALQTFLESEADAFDAILMDIQMPEMNGLEATRAIRASVHPRAREIPIIALTANAFEEDIIRCREAGMNAHCSKPVNIMEIRNVIAGLIG